MSRWRCCGYSWQKVSPRYQWETDVRQQRSNGAPLGGERHSRRWLAFTLSVPVPVLVSLAEGTGNHYRSFRVIRGEKSRLIDNPDRALKEIQRRIRSKLLAIQPLPDFVHGCVKGCSTFTNAWPHRNQASIASIDIRDFYPNVDFNKVYRFWRKLGLGPKLARILTKLTTTHGCLPQGAPTSDALANLVLRPVDDEIRAIAASLNLSLSRYLDNLDLAGSRSRECIPLVIDALHREGFSVRHKKTSNAGPGRAHIVTGYNVNGGLPSVPKWYRMRVRARVHHLIVASQRGEVTKQMVESVKGHLAYIRKSNPGTTIRLERQLANAGISLAPKKRKRRRALPSSPRMRSPR